MTQPQHESGDEPLVPLDERVAAALVENHRRFLDFLARRLGGDREVAEELLQEAFARGVERAPGLREPESAVAWFYRLLRNALVDHRRRRGLAAESEPDLDPEVPDPRDRAELCRCVALLADTLKPEYASALRRVDVDGVQVKAWAAEEGITPNNASVRLGRAREALRKRVQAACRTCAEHGCLDCTCGAPARPPGSRDPAEGV